MSTVLLIACSFPYILHITGLSQEEEPGLKMLPSAFLADLKRECKTFSGKEN